MEEHYLYRVVNTLNNKVYVGITCDIKRRYYEHFKKRSGYTSVLKTAMEKYGKNSFTFETLVVGSRSYIVDLEEKFIRYYKEKHLSYNIRDGGEDYGSGHTINKRSDDKPCYVKGFWFPNGRVAREKLKMSRSAFYRNKGKELKEPKPKKPPRPIRGSSEDIENRRESMIGKNSGNSNGMRGKTGKAHPRARRIEIYGIKYNSISDAVRQTELTKSIIEKFLKKQKYGFKYLD